MNVQAIADLHGFLPEIPPCDLLLIAGDVCPDYHSMSRARYGTKHVHTVKDHGEAKQAAWLDTEFREWLRNVPADTVVGVAGNHDFVFDRARSLVPDLPWVYLEDSAATVAGLKIYGLPWVPHLPRWAFSLPDDRLQMAYEAVPEGTDVVISHGPSLGYLDHTAPQFGSIDAGAEAANQMLSRVTPQVYVCGHIHEARGHAIHKTGTSLYNVAHVDERYKGFRGPVQVPELS